MTAVEVSAATEDDEAAVRRLLVAAFPTADEADLVEALHADDDARPEVELVARAADGRAGESVVGYVLFTRVVVPGTANPDDHLVLAPLAVLPPRQGAGIGSRLVEAGVDAAASAGFDSVLLHGSPDFYSRFEFGPATAHGLENPFDLPDADFQALELRAGGLVGATGPVEYPSPFQAL